MKLYYSPLSVYSAKPRIAMFEKAIAHETRLVNWDAGHRLDQARGTGAAESQGTDSGARRW